MHANDLVIDAATDWQAVKDIAELLPKLDIIAALALVIESINPGNRRALVVSAKHEEVLGKLELVCEQKRNGFKTLLATVHIIT